MDPMNVPAKFEVRRFTHSWDNRAYFKTLGSPWLRPRYFFSKNFHGRLFGWTLWNCECMVTLALPVPEIIYCGRRMTGIFLFQETPSFHTIAWRRHLLVLKAVVGL